MSNHLEELKSNYKAPTEGFLSDVRAMTSIASTVIDQITEYIFTFAADAIEEQRDDIVEAAEGLVEWALDEAESRLGIKFSAVLRASALTFVNTSVNRIIDAALKPIT